MNKEKNNFLKRKQKVAIKTLFMCICVGLLGFNSFTIGMKNDDEVRQRLAPKLHIIFDYVKKGLPDIDIADMEKKDLVIVLGRTQIGKSTTINSLLGARLRPSEDGRKIIMDTMKSVSGQKFAAIGTGGVSETKLPAVYPVPKSSFAFLDTRGLFDVRHNPEEDIAASILTEMAVNKAKTIRVMFVEKYDRLQGGVAEFRPLGAAISKIVSGRMGQQVPILFVFNQFTYNYRPGHTPPPPTEQELVQTVIPRKIEELIDGESRILSQLVTSVAGRLGRPADTIGGLAARAAEYFFGSSTGTGPDDMEDIARDEQFQRALAEVDYVNLLRYNKEKRNIGYIDPLEEQSRGRLRRALHDLSPVTRDYLAFNGYNSERVEFNRSFSEELGALLPLINLKRQMSKYSVPLLEELAGEAENCHKYHNGIHENFDARYSEEKMRRELEEAYAISSQGNQIQQLQSRKTQLQLENGIILQLIVNLLDGGDKLYWVDEWKKEYSFFPRFHSVFYPHTTPFSKWEEELNDTTLRLLILNQNSPQLDIVYISKFRSTCEGKVMVYIAPKDDPETQALIESKKQEVKTNDEQVAICDRQLEELQKAIPAGLKEKVAARARIYREQKKRLEQAVNLRQRVDALYAAKKDKIETCIKIAKNIRSVGPISIEFLKVCKQLGDQEEVLDLPERLRDSIFNSLLLDPVQLRCPNEAHGQALERWSIVDYLRNNGTCPFCRARIGGITPVAPMVAEVSAIIDEIYTTTLTAQGEVERMERIN